MLSIWSFLWCPEVGEYLSYLFTCQFQHSFWDHSELLPHSQDPGSHIKNWEVCPMLILAASVHHSAQCGFIITLPMCSIITFLSTHYLSGVQGAVTCSTTIYYRSNKEGSYHNVALLTTTKHFFCIHAANLQWTLLNLRTQWFHTTYSTPGKGSTSNFQQLLEYM